MTDKNDNPPTRPGAEFAHHDGGRRQYAVKGSSDRAFGLIVGGIALVAGVWLAWPDHGWAWAIAAAGGVLVLGALAAPGLLRPLNHAWTRLALLINRVTSPILLGFVYFLLIVPTGAIMALFGKDPLNRRLKREASTYWIERQPPGPAPDTMKNQF